jgi:hypothetical protein
VSAYAVATQGRSVDYAKRLHQGLNTVILRSHTGSNGIFITLIDGDPNLNVKYAPNQDSQLLKKMSKAGAARQGFGFLAPQLCLAKLMNL